MALALYDELCGSQGEPLRIFDFACGSGSVSEALAQRGHIVTGLDLSKAMIELAGNRYSDAGSLRFLEGDLLAYSRDALAPEHLHDLPVGSDYDLVVAFLDVFNHFLSEADLQMIIGALASLLAPNGLLVFDVLREDYMRDVLPDLAFGEVLDDDHNVYLIWENENLDDPLGNRAHLTFFERMTDRAGRDLPGNPTGESKGDIKGDLDGDLDEDFANTEIYRKLTQVIEERFYDAATLRTALKASGLELLGEIDPESLYPS